MNINVDVVARYIILLDLILWMILGSIFFGRRNCHA